MEVILREDIDKLGARGQVVKVAAGYARNFLLPQRLAVAATESNKKIVEQERQAHLRTEAKVQADAPELAKLMAGGGMTIAQKAGENDQLFGSVTSTTSPTRWKSGLHRSTAEDPTRRADQDAGRFQSDGAAHKEVAVEVPVHVVKEE